jgi:hypothetical protein
LWYSKPVGDYFEYYEDSSLKEKGTYLSSKGDSDSEKRVIKKCKKGKCFESIKIPL